VRADRRLVRRLVRRLIDLSLTVPTRSLVLKVVFRSPVALRSCLYSVILPVDIIHATILHLADTPSDYITFVDCLFCLSEMSESDLSELIASTRAGTSAAIEALDLL
jgi:hypothetical protein